MDSNCIHYFEDMCMLCMMETESEIEPYIDNERDNKDCKEFIPGTFLVYEIELTEEDVVENNTYKIATKYKYEGKHPKVKPGDIFEKMESQLYREVIGDEVTLGELAKLYIAVDKMLYDFSNQWEDGMDPYEFMKDVTEIMREINTNNLNKGEMIK